MSARCMPEFAQIVLASASPRRAELLSQIGIRFEQCPVSVDERPLPAETPPALAVRLARTKAAAAARRDGLPALGSDTVVAIDDQPLGKPRDRSDALAMLARLSGRTHRVYTGVSLARGDRCEDALAVSAVTMRRIGPEEAAAYWASGECADKAGAYAIQGLGAVFVEHLAGSYSAVMGLPLFETAELLRRAGIEVFATTS